MLLVKIKSGIVECFGLKPNWYDGMCCPICSWSLFFNKYIKHIWRV